MTEWFCQSQFSRMIDWPSSPTVFYQIRSLSANSNAHEDDEWFSTGISFRRWSPEDILKSAIYDRLSICSAVTVQTQRSRYSDDPLADYRKHYGGWTYSGSYLWQDLITSHSWNEGPWFKNNVRMNAVQLDMWQNEDKHQNGVVLGLTTTGTLFLFFTGLKILKIKKK